MFFCYICKEFQPQDNFSANQRRLAENSEQKVFCLLHSYKGTSPAMEKALNRSYSLSDTNSEISTEDREDEESSNSDDYSSESQNADSIINFGKYKGKGKTYWEVLKTDPSYCEWIKSKYIKEDENVSHEFFLFSYWLAKQDEPEKNSSKKKRRRKRENSEDGDVSLTDEEEEEERPSQHRRLKKKKVEEEEPITIEDDSVTNSTLSHDEDEEEENNKNPEEKRLLSELFAYDSTSADDNDSDSY